jgi:hypothetical protein
MRSQATAGREAIALTDEQLRLSNFGIYGSAGIIANVLKPQGIEPIPERGKKTTWKEFLRAHWNVIAAADFLHP